MSLRDRMAANPRVSGMRDGFILWHEAAGLDDAGLLVARWLRRDLAYLPWDSNTPYAETIQAPGFAEAMARVNDLGLLTIGSQPGTPRQREYVTLVVPHDLVSLIEHAAEEEGLLVEVAPKRARRRRDRVLLSERLLRPLRLRESIAAAAFAVGLGSGAVAGGITRGEHVVLTVIDPTFGRLGEVQEFLALMEAYMQAGEADEDFDAEQEAEAVAGE